MSAASRQNRISPKTVGRLSLYHRALIQLPERYPTHIFSHELARMCGSSAAQVRRDLMAIGTAGCSSRGYEIASLVQSIDAFFANTEGHLVALVGIGNLGRSLIDYFNRRYHRLTIAAAFDRDPAKVDRVVQGVRCYRADQIPKLVPELGITIAILAIPEEGAQEIADTLVASGVRGLLNFAPVTLRAPSTTRVEEIDISVALDKLAYFARKGRDKNRRGDG